MFQKGKKVMNWLSFGYDFNDAVSKNKLECSERIPNLRNQLQ